MARIKKNKSVRRRWRIAAGVGVAVCAGVLAGPFVFTNQIMRYLVARSALRRFDLRFQEAHLSALGGLTLQDVTLRDIGESAGKPLIHAGLVRIDFRWSEIFSGRFEGLEVDDARLFVRAGKDTPATVLRLMSNGGGAKAGGAARGEMGAFFSSVATLPFDQILVSGSVQPEGYDRWQSVLQLPPRGAVPFRMAMSAGMDSGAPSRDVALVVGAVESSSAALKPVVAARARIRLPRGKDPELVIDTLTASDISAQLGKVRMPWLAARDYVADLGEMQISGTLTLSAVPTFDGSFEDRDCTVHATDAGPPIVLDHFSAGGRLTGPLTDDPLHDLSFSEVHAGCDLVQYDVWRIDHAAAGVRVGATQIDVVNLEGSMFGGGLTGSLSYDTEARQFSHASLTLQDGSISRVLARIADAVHQPALPVTADGQFTARVSINDFDGERLTSRVDLLIPGQLRVTPAALLPRVTELAPLATGPAAGSDAIVVDNLTLGGIITWSGEFSEVPELSHGRLRADDAIVRLPAVSGAAVTVVPLTGKSISADFSLGDGMARLDDLSFSTGEATQISASGRYDLRTGMPERGTFSATHFEAASLAGLWPDNTAIDGEFDISASLATEAGFAALSATIAGSQQVGIRLPAAIGTIGIVGQPVLAIHLSNFVGSPIFEIDTGTLRGLSAVKIDAPAMKWLHDHMADRFGEGSLAAKGLERFRDGMLASLDEAVIRGRLDLTPGAQSFAGSFRGGNFGLQTVPGAERLVRLGGLSFKTNLTATLAETDLRTILRLSDGEASADKLLLDANAFSSGSAQFAFGHGALSFPMLAFNFGGGAFHGDASVVDSGGLDSLHLKFNDASSAAFSANLAPAFFSAQGPVSGAVDLARGSTGQLAGTLTLSADSPGTLAFSREAVTGPLASVSKATAAEIAAGGATLPSNFDQLVAEDLAHYRYTSGHALVSDAAGGAQLNADFARDSVNPDDPGYEAQVTVGGNVTTMNIGVQLKDVSLPLPGVTAAGILARALGFTATPAANAATQPGGGALSPPASLPSGPSSPSPAVPVSPSPDIPSAAG